MMPYEVGKTFIIRVPLLSIETYKELCSEKDGLPVIKTKETLTGYTHKLFTLRRKKGTEKPVPIFYAHAKAEEGHRGACSYLLCPREGGRRAQRSLFLSPVPTLRRKKGTGGRSPHHSQFPSMTVLHIFYACGTINRKQAF